MGQVVLFAHVLIAVLERGREGGREGRREEERERERERERESERERERERASNAADEMTPNTKKSSSSISPAATSKGHSDTQNVFSVECVLISRILH